MSDERHSVEDVSSFTDGDKSRRAAISIGISIVALFAIGFLFGPGAVEQLVLGWLYFPARVIPQMTVDFPTFIVGVLSLVTFVILLRRWLCFLADHRPWSDEQRQHWTGWGTALRLTCLLVLLFASGTAIVGLVHQSIWLATSRDVDHADRRETPHVASLADFTGLRRAVNSQTKEELHQLSLAIHNFGDVSRGNLPAGGTLTADGRPLHGWITYLGPYLSFTNHEVDFSTPFNVPPNDRLFRCGMNYVVVQGVSPAFNKDGYGLSHIAANIHLFPVIPTDGGDLREVNSGIDLVDLPDGGANTLMLGEAAGTFQPWGSSWNVRDPNLGLDTGSQSFGTPLPRDFSLHVMADGSVRELSHTADQEVFRKLGSPGTESGF